MVGSNSRVAAICNLLLSLGLGGALVVAFLALSAPGEVAAFARCAETSQIAATIRYVAPGGSCGGAEPCYGSVQTAVDAAESDDEIRVAAGVYTDVHFRAGEQQAVYVSKNVTLRGGYDVGSWSTSDPETNLTVLDAQGASRVVYITGPVSPVIEGFHITGGNAPSDSPLGGGVYVDGASPIFVRNWITGNVSTVAFQGAAYGGGLYLRDSAAVLLDNEVSDNSAASGGGAGIYLRNSPARLRGNLVRGNEVTGINGRGGGIYLNDCLGVVLTANTIMGNSADRGGGLYVRDSEAALHANQVLSNTTVPSAGAYPVDDWSTRKDDEATASDFSGGGLFLDGGTTVVNGDLVMGNYAYGLGDGGGLVVGGDAQMTNVVVADNRAGGRGAGAFVEADRVSIAHGTVARNGTLLDEPGAGIYVSAGTTQLTNTVIVSHAVGITAEVGAQATLHGVLWYSNTLGNYGGEVSATGAVTGDPAFSDDGYHLTPGSAAIDRGLSTAVRFDIDNQPRFGVADLGVDEYWAPGQLEWVFLPIVARSQ